MKVSTFVMQCIAFYYCICVKVIDLDDPEVKHGLQIISTSKSFRLGTRWVVVGIATMIYDNIF